MAILAAPDSERIVAVAMMRDASFRYEFLDTLGDDCFTDTEAKLIVSAIRELEADGKTATMVAVAHLLENKTARGVEITSRLFADYGYMDAYSAVTTVVDFATRRKVSLYCRAVESSMADLSKPVEDVETEAAKIKEEIEGKFHDDVKDMGQVMNAAVSYIDEMGKPGTTTPTGFKFIDGRGGLRGGELSIVAGASSMGKTSFAMTMLYNMATRDDAPPVAVFSMEMSNEELGVRLLSMVGGDWRNAGNAYAGKEDTSTYWMRMKNFNGKPIYFDDSSVSTLSGIIGMIRKLKMKRGIKGVFIDYLQLIRVQGRTENREGELAAIARGLKNIAKELGIWIVLLSQLNRDDNNPRPTMGRLRGSGQIEEAADNVYLIYRPEYYGKTTYGDFGKHIPVKGTAEIIQAKGRNQGTGSFYAYFDSMHTRFFDYEEQRQVTPIYGAKNDENLPF